MSDLPKRYTPISPPERGGFGGVLKCRDHHLDRNVAIKFIQDELEKQRLSDELHSLLQVQSKHVVQVYDIITLPDNSMGIVEEYVEGFDLWDSEYPRLSEKNYLKILWQIATGISDIHDANVIHRDIKPSNMKLDNNEKIVKIFDFGLSRTSGHNNKTKGFKGSTGFAAPELYSNNTFHFSNAIDIYAFGATAIYLADHSLPEELNQHPPSSLQKNIFDEIPISIPTDLSDLLIRCSSKDPKERPRISLIRDEIARYLLQGKHQALIIAEGKILNKLNAENTIVRLKYGTIGEINISYDQTRFKISLAKGEVFINNTPAKQATTIPDSCVIAIGNPSRRNNERKFITFDVSHPEVVI